MAAISSDTLFRQVREATFDAKMRSYLVENGAGSIRLVPAEITWYSLQDAVARLHDLHLRACGDVPAVQLVDTLTQAQAKSIYRVSIASLIIQATSLPGDSLVKFLAGLVDAALRIGSAGGLEAVFASAVLSYPSGNGADLFDAFSDWRSLPFDSRPGGGHQFSVAYSHADGHFLRLTPQAIKDVQLTSNMTMDAANILRGTMGETSTLHDQCVGGATLLGAWIGAVALYPEASDTGAELGAIAGNAVGMIACPDIAPSSAPPPAPAPSPSPSPDPDPDPEPKDPDDDPLACWPLSRDLSTADPYSSFALFKSSTYAPQGSGLNAFISTKDGLTRLARLETLKAAMPSIDSIRKLGQLGSGGGAINSRFSDRIQSMKDPIDRNALVAPNVVSFDPGSVANFLFPRGIPLAPGGDPGIPILIRMIAKNFDGDR